ncbi:MAG: amidohydrolase [Candidatus Marinimicrobia bacterium]|jgi:amidohydrolase|nr:amidohydrolase [Candidatus Neomarinimicrobiota bacterium]MBT3633826.1 amidohydrolase [Candidatus Neomarinimicrobiota bacterium]MBT3682618.1 amidohydrolase [Candidatus Neomarinimicrobiota bacterium]MBT3759382.1 amidohydrolase [Candidatus Neomarinimicrobiota bacterium]MBT3894610.1 amidohydrolase [Candidatus Neomarinimicrobiota bacterium]
MNINIRPEIERLKETIIQTRRDIHRHPELGFNEYRTASLISDRLTELGLEVNTAVGKTGVTGLLKGNEDGPTIALRADMDALPIQETGDVPYKSVNDGIMHACGHDGHVAMLLGAAEVLSKNSQFNGNVKFIFQPAEEGEGGARFMIDDGVLIDVDEIYGIHLWNYQKFGSIGIKAGPILASADIFDLTISGTGGHGATPHGTHDPIVAAAQLITAFQTIVSRNTNPLESTVVSIGTINGGYNFNIISDIVKMTGTTRAYTEENRNMIKVRMAEIIAGIEKMFSVKIHLNYEDGYPPTINDSTLADHVIKSASKIAPDGVESPYMTMGGEDFSYYGDHVPACFFFIGSAPDNRQPMSIPHHCSHFDIDEKALLVGSSVFIQLIEDRLSMTSD